MAYFTKTEHFAACLLLAILTGCAWSDAPDQSISAFTSAHPTQAPPTPTRRAGDSQLPPRAPTFQTASWVSYQDTAVAAPMPPAPSAEPSAVPSVYGSNDPRDPFGNQVELSVEQLVAEVQARNPSLQAVSAAWRAATQRYPQVVSLDDPMFVSMIGPKGVGMDNGGGWMVEASQKIPWSGKRALRGSAAAAEADATKGDVGDTRLRLAEATRAAFYDYYLAHRQLEVNASTRQIVAQFRETAWNKYQVNQTTQQDVLQADVELAMLESRRMELARDGQVAAARINTLLHRAADHPLPPPPATAPLPDLPPTAEALQRSAAESRPDLFAQLARVRAEEANLALACKEYYPDMNLVAKYDGFMPEAMRPQVGMEINVPLQRARRSAAVSEASQRVAQRRAEYQNLLDQVRYEVQSGYDRANQAGRVARLYEEKILPAARRSLQSAQANYTTGTLDFLRLLDAERQVNAQQEMYYQAIADYHRRLAELQRAAGGSLPVAVDVE